ncbi:MAG: hypothetical protein MI746_18240 [Pseudomonadales bacterium]|nr:hypothetical protein [Pseudomonadales bacterium]
MLQRTGIQSLALLALGLLASAGSAQVATDELPSIEFKTSRAYIYQTGDDGLQPFIVTIANPTEENLRNVSFSIFMPAGLVLGSVDQECDEVVTGSDKTLTCTIQQVDANKVHITDFFVDGPLSTAPNGSITMELTIDDIRIVEQTEFDASLADGNREIKGSILNIELIRDIRYDGNANTIPDIDEQLLQPGPTEAFEDILARDAVLDVLFLVSTTARDYLTGQLDQRIAQLVTGTSEVFRENGIPIKVRNIGVQDVDYSEEDELSETLTEMQEANSAAFEDLPQSVVDTGADLVVLLHAIEPAVDDFCGVSSSVALGRQGDFQADYHRGRLLTVLDVGPSCLGIDDLATSFSLNMGVVSTREVEPDGGTFSFSSGYGIRDTFRTIATRVGAIDLGTAADVNRFSNPENLCIGLPCGVDSDDIAMGADAVQSLTLTRHVVSAINDPVVPVGSIPTRLTPTFSNAIDVLVEHQSIEEGALTQAFAEYQVSVTNTFNEPLYDLAVSALHLDNGFLDLTEQNYRYHPEQCAVSGAALDTADSIVGDMLEKSGRLVCYIDAIAPDETVEFSYFIQIDETPPELDEEENYYHEIIAVNSVLQMESADCIAVYTDLLDASIGSNVCTLVDELLLSTDVGTGFIDLEGLPTITGNLLTVPFIRLNDSTLVSAQFQVVNFDIGEPELVLLSYREINPNLIPVLQSSYNEATERLSIFGLELEEAVYDVFANLVVGSDPVTFEDVVLLEVMDTGDEC